MTGLKVVVFALAAFRSSSSFDSCESMLGLQNRRPPLSFRMLKDRIQTLVGDVADTSSSLSGQGAAYKQERFLVSWVLLTRIPEDELVELWKTHGTNLEAFAIAILRDNRDPCHLLYIRLFAQACSRLAEWCSLDLGKRLFEAWDRHERKQDLKLHIDVLSCLEVLVANHHSVCQELNVVEKLWDFHTSICIEIESSKDEHVPKDESYPSFEWETMAQTLSATLQGSDASYYSPLTLNETTLAVFQRHRFEDIPQSMAPKILSWVSKSCQESNDLSPKLRSLWVEWTLGLFQTLASNNNVDAILRHTGVPDDLNRLLLAIIVSPRSDKESNYGSLRAMAWQTLVSILETCGWAWTFRIAPSGKLGTGTPLCTWTRLASGEWRLQLQIAESRDVSELEGTQDTIGDATARLLMTATEFCIELSEKNSVSLSSDAVLHLYQSLEDSLMSTVEYITLERESRIVGPFSTTATRLFGTLLREFDVWTLQKKEVETSQATIDGLAYLLETSEENCLFPAIANILEASDADAARKKDILKLWDPFLSYMERFWEKAGLKWSQQGSTELCQIIPWACTCVEWWIDGAFPESKNTVQNRRRIQVAVLKLIDCAMPRNGLNSQSRASLSLALGCYMTLSEVEGELPAENESMLIFRALQICETTDF